MASFEQKNKAERDIAHEKAPVPKTAHTPAPSSSPPLYLQDLANKESAALSAKDQDEEQAEHMAQQALPTGSDSAVHGHSPSSAHAEALAEPAKSLMEQQFAADFSQVRLHADDASARHAASLGAKAFTVGHDIRFGAGQFRPNAPEGRALLAHELAHVVQQSQAGENRLQKARLLDWADDRAAQVSDDDIRTTNEFKAFMDPSLVWQSSDHMTEAEAIQACRYILAALRNGITVNWSADARSYMERARAYLQQIEDLGVEQQTWLESEALAGGQTTGEYMHQVAQTGGYGGGPAPWWDGLSALDRLSWLANAILVIERVKTSISGTDLEPLVSARGIVPSPRECESLSAYAYFSSGDNKLHVGREWIEVAENDPQDVFDNIAHELGGHFEYEQYGLGMAHSVTEEVLSNLLPSEEAVATSGPKSLYSAYAYPETEIFAELREYDLRRPGSQGDRPQDDIPRQLRAIQARYAPNVAHAIVLELRLRVQEAANISDAAKTLFDESVHDVFPGLLPL